MQLKNESRHGMRNRVLPTHFDDSDDEYSPDDKKRLHALRCLSVVVGLVLFKWGRKIISRFLVLVTLFFTLIAVEIRAHRFVYVHWQELHSMAPIVEVERVCPKPAYETLTNAAIPPPPTPGKICITTLTDEKHRSTKQKLLGWRDYEGVMEMGWQNKQDYATKHGYFLFDGSDAVDGNRPPGWSKVKAAQKLMKMDNCSWVFWMDADTVIMDSDRRVEDFLPSDPTKHLVIAQDLNFTRYNSGSWLVRNSEWGHDFLDSWWDMTSFIRPVGMALSGDQDSMNALILERDVFSKNGGQGVSPPQCTFNSFTYMIPPWEQANAIANIKDQKYYMSPHYYHKGDFLAHTAGVENKRAVLQKLLRLAK